MNSVQTGDPASASDLLRWQFQLAHRLLELTAGELSAGVYSPDVAALARSHYARSVVCEDLSIHSMLAIGHPLALAGWAGRTGLSELPPWGAQNTWRTWAYRVRIDMDALCGYARAVYAATEDAVAALSQATSGCSRGEASTRMLSGLLLTMAMQRGEIMHLLDSRNPAMR